jgi:hypothetical protein
MKSGHGGKNYLPQIEADLSLLKELNWSRESPTEQDRVKEVRSRHVNENKEIKKTTKRDGEGQKSNTGATPNRESNNVEISEKKERERKRK